MNEFKDFLETVTKNRTMTCSAVQGVHQEDVQLAQLHFFRGGDDHRELFALVLSIHAGMCRIIPGSLDARSAGTGDVIVPRSVMGGCISLSPTMARNVPLKALGEVFAKFDELSFERALACEAGGATCGYRSAFPFVGARDSRQKARRIMRSVINAAVDLARMEMLTRIRGQAWRRPNPFARMDRNRRDRTVGFVGLISMPGLRMAAAEPLEPIAAKRRLDGFDGELLIRYVPDERLLNIRVRDAAGEKSDALDGWAVLGSDASVLGYFDGAAFSGQVPEDFDGGIRFLDLEGNPHDLIDEK